MGLSGGLADNGGGVGGTAGGASGVVTPEQYGAVGNGTTNDTTALQAALNQVKAHGGTLLLSTGKTYKTTATLVGDDNAAPFRISGEGGKAWHGGSPVIHFTGSTGSLLTLHSAFGVEVDHVLFHYDPNTFKGAGTYLINMDWSGAHSDVNNVYIHDCSFEATASVNPSNGCQSFIRMEHTIFSRIVGCGFAAAQEGIRLGDPSGWYANVITIDANTFNFQQSADIMIGSGDCEKLVISNNGFEDAPANGAIYGQSCQMYAATIEKNWFGDYSSTFTPGRWVNGLVTTGNNWPCTIRENFFGSVTKHLNVTGHWLVQGNSFQDGTVYDTSWGNTTLVDIDNYYDTSNATIFGGGFPDGTVQYFAVNPPPNAIPLIQSWPLQANAQAGNYTLVLADAGKVVEGTSASAQTFTIPPNSSVAFPVGTVIEAFQNGAGQITIAAGAGVTLLSDGAKVKTAAQYATIGLRQRATNAWVLSGDLA